MYNQFNVIKTFQLRGSNSQLNEFNNHTGVVCLRLAPKQQILVAGEDHSIKLYDVVLNKCIRTVKTGVESQVMEMLYLGKSVAVLHEKGVVSIYNSQWQKIDINLGVQCSTMGSLLINGLYSLLAGGEDGLVQCIKLESDLQNFRV